MTQQEAEQEAALALDPQREETECDDSHDKVLWAL